MLQKLLIFTTSVGIWAVFSFGLVSSAVFAQTNNNQIVSGLCQGVNLKISDNPSGGTAGCNTGGESITDKINKFLRRLINIISAIIGVVAVIMIIFGGFRYVTSGGNDSSVTSAKNTILYAIIGLVIVALAQLLVRFVLNLVAS
jgi:Type IV secretion system pilin